MQTFLLYVLPTIEAVIIVALYTLLRIERTAARKDYEHRLAEAIRRGQQKAPRVHVRLPTKEEIAAARERGDDWKFHNPVPQPTQIVGRPAMQRKR